PRTRTRARSHRLAAAARSGRGPRTEPPTRPAGDKAFPTVVVDIHAMVNSSARQVIAAVRAGQPGVLPGQGIRRASRLAQAAGFLTRRKPRPGHAVDGPSRHTPV
ncbi:MAG TPA: hypothetical protein VF940_06105, partial [Streptosporangiaceae bacterium]